MDQTDQACPRRVATEVLPCRNGFSRNLLELKRQRRGVGYPRLAVYLTPTLWLTLLLLQDAEKVRQQRSRFVQTLNGDPAASPLGGAHRLGAPYSSHRAPQEVRLGPSLAAALLDGLFEHPARFGLRETLKYDLSLDTRRRHSCWQVLGPR